MTREPFDLLLRAGSDRVARDPAGPCPSAERLVALYAGHLSEAESASIGEHLATCPRCLELARDARQFAAAMREEPEPAEAGPRFRALPPSLRWAAAAALLIAVAGSLALYLGSRRTAEVVVELAKAPFVSAALDPDAILYRDAGGLDPDVERSLQAAMAPYQRDDFAAAESSLQAHLALHPTDQRARFYRAVSLLLLERDEEALALLEDVERMASPVLVGEARWYRALGLLRSGQRDTARAELQLIAQSEGSHRSEAMALLDRLGRSHRE